MLPERWRSWWWDVALLAGFAGTTWLVAAGVTHDLDIAARDWSDAHRPDWAYWMARALNLLGQGWLLMWVITGALTLYLAITRRNWRYVLPGLAAYVLTGAITGPVKLLTDRAAPHADTDIDNPVADPVLLFHYDKGVSYPSGHVVNAIVWWGVIVLLMRQIPAISSRISERSVRWIRFTPPIVILCTTTYLGFHWVTDGVAAIFLGLFTWRLFLRLPWPRILPR